MSQRGAITGLEFLMGVTFAVLLTLKLLGHIDWSWWWVAAPLWGGVLLGIVVVGMAFIFADRVAGRKR